MEQSTTRACPRCGVEKPISAFGKNKRRADGRQCYCRSCVAAYHKEWYERNREDKQAKNREWWEAHPGVGVRYCRTYYGKHRERRTAEARAWNVANRDRYNANVANCASKRRAAKLGLGCEDIRRQDVFQRDGGKCHICGKRCDPKDWHLDHLVPLSLGGLHAYSNVAVSHPMCNQRRSNTGPAQLRLEV